VRALKLFAGLTAYYAVLAAAIFALLSLLPDARAYLPIGGTEALISNAQPDLLRGTAVGNEHVRSIGESLYWLVAAILGALLTALPVSRVYMEVRDRRNYDQSLVDAIVALPIVVTGIVIIVQHSLALAFALAGIAAAVRFRNTLKSSGDALFILLAVGIGIAAGIGAVELALIMSAIFNYCFVALWAGDYGAHSGTKRYMRDLNDTGEAPDEADG